MMDNNELAVIESASHDTRYCPTCSAPTTIVADPDGTIWLTCSEVSAPRPGVSGWVDRARSGLHLRRRLLAAG